MIHIVFNELPRRCNSYDQYMDRIEKRLVRDFQNEYPDLELSDTDAIWDILMDIYTANPELRIIFVLDEWDFIFHQEFVTEEDKKDYLLF